jgi:hypothetical protein
LWIGTLSLYLSVVTSLLSRSDVQINISFRISHGGGRPRPACSDSQTGCLTPLVDHMDSSPDTRLWATAAACFGGGLALGMLLNQNKGISSTSTNAVGAPCKLRAMGFCGEACLRLAPPPPPPPPPLRGLSDGRFPCHCEPPMLRLPVSVTFFILRHGLPSTRIVALRDCLP